MAFFLLLLKAMAIAGGYFQPGISVVSVARCEATTVGGLRAFVAAVVPYAEQLCLAVDSRALLDVALEAGPKVRSRLLPPQVGRGQAWQAASQLAEHEWSFVLRSNEALAATDFAKVRLGLPHVGPRAVTVGGDRASGGQVRLWRSGWNMAPDGTGGLVPAGASVTRPSRTIDLTQIPVPMNEGEVLPGCAPLPQRGPVLVCGMHRSGTSMVARILNLLGIALGDRLAGVHTQAHSSNPKGHWEDLAGQAVHADILSAAAGLHTAWGWTQNIVVSPRLVANKNLKALGEVAARMSEGGRWGIKDPRISLMLPVWQNVAPGACAVMCVRDPMSVARSLLERDAIPISAGLRIWRAYNERVLQSSASFAHRVLVVGYRELLAALNPQVERIADFLGSAGPVGDARMDQIADFVDGGLRHHRETGDVRAELEAELGPLAVQGEVDAIFALHDHLQRLARFQVRSDNGPDTGLPARDASESTGSSPMIETPPTGSPKLSVVMPYYDNHRTLRSCLESFCEQGIDHNDYEIVVVDDGSDNPARAIMESLTLPVQTRLLDGSANRGQSAATNVGIKDARASLLLLTCADILADRNLLRTHMEAHAHAADRVAVGGFIPYADHLEDTPFMEFLGRDEGPQFSFGDVADVEAMSAASCYAPNLSARRQDLLDCGLFDERFVYGFQDTDLGMRLVLSGVRLLYRAQAVAYHDHPSDLADYCRRTRKVAPAYWLLERKHPGLFDLWSLRKSIVDELPRLASLQEQIAAAQQLEREVSGDPALRRASTEELHRRYRRALHRAFLDGFTADQARVAELLQRTEVARTG